MPLMTVKPNKSKFRNDDDDEKKYRTDRVSEKTRHIQEKRTRKFLNSKNLDIKTVIEEFDSLEDY